MSVITTIHEDPLFVEGMRERYIDTGSAAFKLRAHNYADTGVALTLLRSDANLMVSLISAAQDRIWRAVDYQREDEIVAARKLARELETDKDEHLQLLSAVYWFRAYWMAFRDQYGAEQADRHTIAEAEAFLKQEPDKIARRYGDFFVLVLAAIEASHFSELVN